MSEIEGQAGGRQTGAYPQMPATHRSSTRWILWGGLLLILIAAGYFYFHRGNAGGAAQTATSGNGAGGKGGGRGRMTGPVNATVATATKGSIGIYLDSIGTVTPYFTASITAQASGVLTAVHYNEGQFVQKGDALIDIDPRPYQAQLLQAQGALERDTNLLAQAKMDLERYRTAWAQNGINKQLLDDQEKIVLQDQGTVKNDQGTVDYDQVQLSYCHITAPIAGRVGLRLVDPGNVVQAAAGTVLVVITQEQPMTVIFILPEDSLGRVQEHMRKQHTLPVEAWDRNQTAKLAMGKLQSIDNQIDTTTGTVKLRALFENKNGALYPNQFVNTRLLVNTLNGVTLIPSGAVQHNGQVSFVYAVANGVASVRNVKPGASDGGLIAVEGLNPGEVVATSSFEKLQAGSQVVPAKPSRSISVAEGHAQ
jgi:multidrug efflux system membrane fusion protein